eukprot:gene3008-3288_t
MDNRQQDALQRVGKGLFAVTRPMKPLEAILQTRDLLQQAAGIPALETEHADLLRKLNAADNLLKIYAEEAAAAQSRLSMLACKMFLPWSNVIAQAVEANKQLQGILQ